MTELDEEANHENSISLDRINSNKGYVKGNVRLCTVRANLSKHTMTDRQLEDFCKSVLINRGYKVRKT